MQIKRDSLAVQLSATTTTTKAKLAALEEGQQMGRAVIKQLSTREYHVNCCQVPNVTY